MEELYLFLQNSSRMLTARCVVVTYMANQWTSGALQPLDFTKTK